MSSPNANTSLSQPVLDRVAQDHVETADDVDKEVRNFADAVAIMDEHCDGAMMRALLSAQERWVSEVKAITDDLKTMAVNVRGAINDIGQQDSDNAGGIGNVGLSILKDI